MRNIGLSVKRDLQGSSAEIFLHGAHVTSWKDNSGQVGRLMTLCMHGCKWLALPSSKSVILHVGANLC